MERSLAGYRERIDVARARLTTHKQRLHDASVALSDGVRRWRGQPKPGKKR
jgi:hypothetical protein